ncbi:MAG: cobalamin-dependent protein, partial [Deltaproteobacteria bacterium]|nr:cobalamin-dependent protein [Deltaproteobacteria bacterium]
MKVILVNPPAENLIRTFAPDSLTEEVGLYPPMGLLYIASYARKMHGARVQIEVLDAQVEKMNYKQIRQYLADKKPDVVGISCMTFLLIDALKVAQTAKEVNPQIHVIIGGTHPSIYPEEMLSQSEIDMIVRGEGEYVFSEFLAAFESGKSYAGIKGLGYKENGKNILNPSREFIEDLDRLPFPDRDFLPYKKYYNVLGKGREVMTGLLTSRGCPFNCIFCTSKDGKICRMRSPENVVREIEECYA